MLFAAGQASTYQCLGQQVCAMVGGEAHRVRFLDALPHGDEELVCRLALGVGHDADEIIIRPLKNKFIQ